MSTVFPKSVDIAIVGGGAVGCLLAYTLSKNYRVLLIDAAELPAKPPQTVALSETTQTFLEKHNLLPKEVSAISQIEVSKKGHFKPVRLKHPQAAQPVGITVPLASLQEVLYTKLLTTAVSCYAKTPVESLCYENDAWQIRTHHGRCSARLMIGADGLNSPLRKAVGVSLTSQPYPHQGLIANLSFAKKHGGIAYECFRGAEALALLPTGTHDMSCVWTMTPELGAKRMAYAPAHFCREIEQQVGVALGAATQLHARVCVPFQRYQAQTCIAKRTLLIGSAYQGLHPIGAQGLNLHVRDIKAFLAALSAVADPGDSAVLTGYAAERYADHQQTNRAVHALATRSDHYSPKQQAIFYEVFSHSALLQKTLLKRGLVGGW